MAALHTNKPLSWKEGTSDITADWAGRKVVIATVRVPDWHEDQICGGREAGANAALFASAPQLLDELKALRVRFQRALSANGCDPDLVGFTTPGADAVIAKAEGLS